MMLIKLPISWRVMLCLFLAILCQGCIGSAFKDDPDGQLDKDFGSLNSVPDLPPQPDMQKYQQIRRELSKD